MNINTTAIQILWIITHIYVISVTLYTGAAMFKDTQSAVSLAGVYASPTKSALTGV